MSCEHLWTVRFPDVSGTAGPVEIEPLSFTFDISWGEFDWCKAKFSNDVRDMFDGKVAVPETEFGERRYAELCNEGVARYPLLYDPEHVTFGENYLHVEFRDLQEALDTGAVDQMWETVTAKDAYEGVWEAHDEKFIKGLRFTDNADLGQWTTGPGVTLGSLFDIALNGESTRADKLFNENRITVDFRQTSPAKAIEELNEKFGFQSWVDNDGYLWVGIPELKDRVHLAAPDDERVWRWNSPTIRFAKDRTKAVLVKGAWMDDPRNTSGQPNWDKLFERNTTDQKRVQGFAYRPNVEDGRTVVIDDTGVKKDAASDVAENLLKEEDKRHSGKIGINPTASGRFTDPSDIALGDFIHVVPDDDHFAFTTKTTGSVLDTTPTVHDEDDDCSPGVNNILLLITGIRHRLDNSGRWDIKLDVSYYRFEDYDPIESSTRYFDPTDEKVHETGDMFPNMDFSDITSTLEDFSR